ncbi:leucyl-tRNA synthetase [Ramaria rubella]|nr:leucyl-tRNA synthetase [Ramaria rubella]
MTDSATVELAQTAKRDYLKTLERKYQERWSSEKLFEVDAPHEEQLTPEELQKKYPKWFGNFPFPYMNGSLHLGHGFTISKIEFAAGYERMLGKRVLFPHGFHCTGMPIKASSDKIIREIELFGEDFERFQPEARGEHGDVQFSAKQGGAVDKAKKGKVAAKATGHNYQFQIMESIGVPRAEIKKFSDPMYWLQYFPPIAQEDHLALGTRIDWRRSFITTDANPYYDSFVRWQVNRLYAHEKIKFGERYTIYSPKDGQPCMDHDRSDGEAFGPQEYTAVKMEVVQWSASAEGAIGDRLNGKRVFLVAATLRPETMYGQTNCFVGTALKYGLFAINDSDVYLCTHRAARNMAFQGISTTHGDINQIAEIEGEKIIGTRIKAPFGVHPEVYVLPMDNVLATKGTGVVTSVPSDSPDDFATLTDLKKKPEYYGIQASWAALDPVPVLSTPTYGEMTAPALIKQFKIQSQKDTKQLAEAKEIAYSEGFYSGIMLLGDFKGESVQDAKPKVRDAMIEAGVAFAYAEPEGLVISRSADECVVALMDQWYLDYGEPVWRAQAEKLVDGMETYGDETRNGFEAVLRWLNKWACARTYGLGTKIPWDPTFMVESLSDSSIYMAYYTVAHFLQGGVVNGKKTGPLGVTPDQLTDEIWEYILVDGPWPSPSPLSKEKADIMKYEFNYFYPFDVRSSGKDLIPNHLTFAVYNHAAVFPEKHWPRAMRTNGHLMLNGKKMSKSTGNFLTLRDSIIKFGADATRLALADAGDGIEDANFDEMSANAMILRLHTLLNWSDEMIKTESLRAGEKQYHDRVFEEEINELINITQQHYERMNFKGALKYGFFEMQIARDWYREITADVGMHVDVVKYWIRISALLVQPIIPHFSEHIWSTILHEPQSVQLARWPTPAKPVDRAILDSGVYIRAIIKSVREAEGQLLKKLKSKGGALFDPRKPKSIRIFVATSFPEWQEKVVQVVKDACDPQTTKVDDAKVRQLLGQQGLMKDKRVMPFVQAMKACITKFGLQTAFNRTLPFAEAPVLKEALPYLRRSVGFVEADVWAVEDARHKEGTPGFSKNIIDGSEPGTPGFEFRNV